jgi:ABC-type glycerol-3-phosphate transport system substrate-binding protein
MEVKMSTKKVIALLISLLLVIGLFVGCAKDGTDDTSPTPIASEPTETDTETGSTDEPAEEPGITFPLDEPIAFRIWNGPMSVTAGMNSPNDSFAYKEAEKRTNVHIEWDQPASGSENEQFNLIVTSGDLPDSFMSGYYIGGLDKYINEEVIIDLMPYLEDYGKNFLAIANITEDTWKRNVTDMGRMPGFYNLSKEIEPTWMGPQVREDWLKEMGLQSPVTYDDWYEMLTRARDEKGVPKGYGLASADGLDDALLAGFNMINGFYAKDGQVKFGPYEPELLDYLTMLNEWYETYVNTLSKKDLSPVCCWDYSDEYNVMNPPKLSVIRKSFGNNAYPGTAVICDSDLTAIVFMRVMREHGLVPGLDISIVGYDDLEVAALMEPPLTSVRTFESELGSSTADLLISCIEQPGIMYRHIHIGTELRVRASTAPPPER